MRGASHTLAVQRSGGRSYPTSCVVDGVHLGVHRERHRARLRLSRTRSIIMRPEVILDWKWPSCQPETSAYRW